MKYVEASQFGGPDVLRVLERETPRATDGMLVVEVKAAGVNYADVAARMGSFPAVAKAPFLPGFEIAGVVSDAGKGVNGFNVGDSVAAITSGGGYASHAVISRRLGGANSTWARPSSRGCTSRAGPHRISPA